MTLLDTNVLLWLFIGDTRLSPQLVRSIEKSPADYGVSIVSLWEVATKQAIGKLQLTIDLPQAIAAAGFVSLALTEPHVARYAGLPLLHRDPFDRMLVAQALTENWRLATADSILGTYGVAITTAKA